MGHSEKASRRKGAPRWFPKDKSNSDSTPHHIQCMVLTRARPAVPSRSLGLGQGLPGEWVTVSHPVPSPLYLPKASSLLPKEALSDLLPSPLPQPCLAGAPCLRGCWTVQRLEVLKPSGT